MESLILLVLVLATAFVILVAVDKTALLGLYLLPVLVAAYFLGRRQGVLVALFGVLLVALYAMVNPDVFAPPPDSNPGIGLFIWGASTVIIAYVVGTLYEAQAAASEELRLAYSGLVDILTELVDAVDKDSDSRPVKVARVAARIGVALDLGIEEIENVRVAALLHELHDGGRTGEVLRKASEAQQGASGSAAGVAAVRRSDPASTGLLRDVVRIIDHCGDDVADDGPEASHTDTPLGSRILRVSEAYIRLTAPPPHGAGMSDAEALMDIEHGSGTKFDPAVVDALIMAVGAGPA